MKKLLSALCLALLYIMIQGALAPDIGFFQRPDCTTLNPVAYSTVCVNTGSGGSPAILQSPVLLTPQRSEPVWPVPPGAVSAAKSDDGPAQVPEMTPPVSMRPDQGAHRVRGAGQSPRDVSRQNTRMIARGNRDRTAFVARLPDYYAQWLRDRFPDYSNSRLRHFGNLGIPRRHGQGIGRRQNNSSRLFGN